MKKWAFALVAFVIVSIGIAWFGVSHVNAPATLWFSEHEFLMRVARTDSERHQGLSDTSELPKDQALVFVFPSSERWGIWMKDMNYPIDILWLDDTKKVIHIERNISPDTYPEKTFQPKIPARYVIELKAGVSEASRITIGSQAVFDSTKGTFE